MAQDHDDSLFAKLSKHGFGQPESSSASWSSAASRSWSTLEWPPTSGPTLTSALRSASNGKRKGALGGAPVLVPGGLRHSLVWGRHQLSRGRADGERGFPGAPGPVNGHRQDGRQQHQNQ